MMVPEMNHQLLDLRFHVHLVLQLESKSDDVYPIQIHEEASHHMWIEDNLGEELSKILFKDGDRYKLSRSSQNCQ